MTSTPRTTVTAPDDDDRSAMCVHDDGTEHQAPTETVWDATQQRWVRMSVLDQHYRGTS